MARGQSPALSRFPPPSGACGRASGTEYGGANYSNDRTGGLALLFTVDAFPGRPPPLSNPPPQEAKKKKEARHAGGFLNRLLSSVHGRMIRKCQGGNERTGLGGDCLELSPPFLFLFFLKSFCFLFLFAWTQGFSPRNAHFTDIRNGCLGREKGRDKRRAGDLCREERRLLPESGSR